MTYVLNKLEPVEHPALLVGSNTLDDAGVYQLTEDVALIQTVDFFTPVVDDPGTFGAISATNSLSDIYAMGGTPLTALTIAGIPEKFDLDRLADILAGGQAKAAEAGVPVVGGHTVKDPELKYGLSVTGTIHPDRVVTNSGARPGDILYLTKPIGTGVITTALKNEACPPDVLEEAVGGMLRLNAAASEAMVEAEVHAGTDVTGFGLLGHLHQMAHVSGVAVEVEMGRVPLLTGAEEALAGGHVAGGLKANRSFLTEWVTDETGDDGLVDLLYDPQTSGGLLISVAADRASTLTSALEERGEPVHPVGRVTEGPPGRIRIRP